MLQNPRVAFLVDDASPDGAHAIEIRGDAEPHFRGGESINPRFPNFKPEFVRVRPHRIVSWGLETPGFAARSKRDLRFKLGKGLGPAPGPSVDQAAATSPNYAQVRGDGLPVIARAVCSMRQTDQRRRMRRWSRWPRPRRGPSTPLGFQDQ